MPSTSLPSVAEAASTKPYGGKICEGAEGAYETEVGYVVQGSKVWFAYGKETAHGKALNEDMQANCNIVESIDGLDLVEDANGQKTIVKEGIWYVEGPAQRSDVLNANKRKYPRKIWERHIGDPNSAVQQTIKARGMLGHLEHPKDGRTDGNLGAWVVTESKLLSDGVVWNRYELLDTPSGKILQEYTRKGVRYGSSSRGNGTVGEDGTVSPNDFVVETWDAVMRPSTPGAYPKPSAPAGGRKNVREDSEGSGSNAGVSGEMTEEAKACYEQARGLVETVTEGLADSARMKLTGDLLNSLSSVNGLAKSNAMPTGVVSEVQDWLMKKLKAVTEPSTRVLEGQVDEALGTVTDVVAGKRSAAFTRVIESFQRRMKDSLTEASGLREELNETQDTLKERDAKLVELQKALDESAGRERKLQAKLDVATATLAEMSRGKAKNPVSEAVEEVILEEPRLEARREQLEAADSVDDVRVLAESLLPELMARPPVVTMQSVLKATEPTKRRTLPQGDVVSEGITATRRDVVVTSGGARMAAQAIRHSTVQGQK